MSFHRLVSAAFDLAYKAKSARTKAIMAFGQLDFLTNYQNSLRRQAAWQQALDQTFKKVDIVALPTLQKFPPRIPALALFEAQMLNLQDTAAVNFAGNPALAIPIPLNDAIFPITSLLLVGPRLSEADLLNAGRLIEASSRLCSGELAGETRLRR